MSTKHILLIDDEDDIREVTRISLEMVGGWKVASAGSARDGLAQAVAQHPDAILLDVMIPDMDGPTTFRSLQAKPETRDIPVILLTAKVQAADLRRFADLGVAATIAKPFDPLTLPSQIAAVLGW
jgi:two-component system alkaline phosphatase synthesis response regulator PhoP